MDLNRAYQTFLRAPALLRGAAADAAWLGMNARLRATPTPRRLVFFVTHRCDRLCRHCFFAESLNGAPDELSIDEVARVARGLRVRLDQLNLTGGEPFLRKDLEALVARATSRGFEVSFNTNGWLVTPERARRISEAGASIAYVSLDGWNAETVDHSRGRVGSYDKSMRAIELFDALPNPRVVVACILHGQNASEIPDLYEWVRAAGHQLVLQPLYQNFGYNTYDPDWWRSSPLWPTTPEALAAIHEALDHLSAERLRGGPICNAVEQLQAMKFHFSNPGVDNGQTCRAGHSDLAFDPQGRIRLCYFLEPVGTIYDLAPLPLLWERHTTLRRRWEVSRCGRSCNLLNCNFERHDEG